MTVTWSLLSVVSIRLRLTQSFSSRIWFPRIPQKKPGNQNSPEKPGNQSSPEKPGNAGSRQHMVANHDITPRLTRPVPPGPVLRYTRPEPPSPPCWRHPSRLALRSPSISLDITSVLTLLCLFRALYVLIGSLRPPILARRLPGLLVVTYRPPPKRGIGHKTRGAGILYKRPSASP